MTSQDRSTLRILVVDDNADVAAVLGMLVETLGHMVSVCHSAAEALECVLEFQPDVVFSDIGMPISNGHEFARAVRSRSDIVQPYLAAVTAWDEPDDRRRAFAAGFNAHHAKPLTIERLVTAIEDAQRWLRNRR